jgi:hypothetical protein
MARGRRQAYPRHGEAMHHEQRGRSNHSCLAVLYRSARSDLGGEQPCGPEHARMTAASQRVPDGRRCTDMVERRPGPHGGQAAVVGEETGPCPSRAAGGGGQARRGSVPDLLNLIADRATFIPLTALLPRAQDWKAPVLGFPPASCVPSLAGK